VVHSTLLALEFGVGHRDGMFKFIRSFEGNISLYLTILSSVLLDFTRYPNSNEGTAVWLENFIVIDISFSLPPMMLTLNAWVSILDLK
jgi:hypothetical protein